MMNPNPERPVRVACIVGTRPEAVKMAPVIRALQRAPWAETVVIATAQHRHLLDQVLALFGIVPDVDLDLMRPGQALPDLTARIISGLDASFVEIRPDIVLAQGDTTTVMGAAMVAFYRQIPFGHVEAGLRTGDLNNPFPEEMNRKVAGILARWHFAPTGMSRDNLLAEGVREDTVHVTGNTVIDALLEVAPRADQFDLPVEPSRRLVLLTAHRRENFGAPLDEVCRAVRTLVDRRDDIEFLFPVHPNPNVRRSVDAWLLDHPRIHLVDPLDYGPFVAAMQRATLIVTDSGGVQEEAPALGKPVLVLREETERPEAMAEGVVRLVGCNHDRIVCEVQRLLDDAEVYAEMAKGSSPYGDGNAAQRIVEILAQYRPGA